MQTQVRAQDGASVWNLSQVCWKEQRSPNSQDPYGDWVIFNNREWLCKQRDESLNEAAGYQIAQALGLPLQPWLAFFQETGANRGGPPFTAGILVERWSPFRQQGCLSFPCKTHADLVARALALFLLDGSGDPEWLTNADQSELRLIDLEGVGPQLGWPLNRTHLKDYRKMGLDSYERARAEAIKAGVADSFQRYAAHLVGIDLSCILDLSGLPNARCVEQAIVRGIAGRQRDLGRVLSKPSITPRRTKTLTVELVHPLMGPLQGRIEIRPSATGTWEVRWHIGEIDRDYELSAFGFTQQCHKDRLKQVFQAIEGEVGVLGLRLDYDLNTRWGSAKGLTEDLAVKLAAAIQNLWREIVEDWEQSSPGR